MNKPTRRKAPALTTEEEYRATSAEITALQNQVAQLAARRDGIVQRIQARYAEKIAPLDDAIDAKLSLVEKYTGIHRDTLFPKDRKSLELATATVGFRTGNKTVRLVSKEIEEDTVVATLEANYLGRYVRITKSIDKTKILADVGQHSESKVDCLISSRGGQVVLAEVGLKITQAETFYFEPKAETGETVKPAA